MISQSRCAVYRGWVTSSGGSAVLVEHATEAIMSLYRAVHRRDCVGRFAGPALSEPLEWPRVTSSHRSSTNTTGRP